MSSRRALFVLLAAAAVGACSGGGSRSRPVARSGVRTNSADSDWWARERARTQCLQAQRRSAGAQAAGRQTWRYTGSC